MPHNRKGCLAGCISDYRGDGPDGFGVEPLGGTFGQVVSMAPYVEVRIEGSGATVTVGNSSFSSDPNTAIVKSIEYGFDNKMEGKVEIIDEKGGETGFFQTALQKMEKCVPNIGTGHRIRFKVGWIGVDCNGGQVRKLTEEKAASITQITSQVSNGLIRFSINFGPVESVLQTYKTDVTFGTEEDPIKLTDALQQLANYTEGGSPRFQITYAKKDADGTIKTVDSFDWIGYGEESPKAKWPCNSQNKYETIAAWISPYRVQDGDEDKGVTLIHDPDVPDKVTLLLDPTPTENEKQGGKVVCNYIVNGGSCSNVLEFNPTLDIVSVMRKTRSGGSSGGALTSNGEFVEDQSKPTPGAKGADAGPQTQIVPTQAIVYTAGTSNAQKEMNKSQDAHFKAENVNMVAKGGITADLRIVGSTLPEYHSLQSKGKFVSITIINPLLIQGGDDKSCGDFLQKADCNQFLSNKSWMILGWSHSIQEGSFVTTLKVLLAAPGFDNSTSAENSLGANDTGIAIENTC